MKKELEFVDTAPDIVWGAAAIGQVINLNERQAYHRLEQGQIPCARKFGNMWAASRRSLLGLFAPEAASPAPRRDDGEARKADRFEGLTGLSGRDIPSANQDWQDWPAADEAEAGS